jgi:hypothetical protein
MTMAAAHHHPPMATLRFFADDLSPSVVDKILSVTPDVAAPKGGGLFRRGDGGRVPAHTGTWFITTDGRVSDSSPEKHLAWVVKLALGHYQKLREHIPGMQADLSLLVHDRGFRLSDLPSELLKQAVEVGELEIEAPDSGVYVILNKENVQRHLQENRRH